MRIRLLSGLAAVLLLLVPGCKDPDGGGSGGTSGAALYAFDVATSEVFVWKDISVLYEGAKPPVPDHKITSSLFSKAKDLAWGGLCVDAQRGLLYLISETGDIVRVSRLRAQTGNVSTLDVVSFRLASDRLTDGKFGQASLDPQNDTLYITENGSNGTRVWVVSSASSQAQDASVPLQALLMDGDSGGTGVAAGSGAVFAFMSDGSPVGMDALTGPRLRKGTSSGFDVSQVILGDSTGLGVYGSLALDIAGSRLFVARHNTDANSTAPPIQVFPTGQFGLSYNQAPVAKLGNAASQGELRVIAHAGNKDWLVGLRGQEDTGYDTIYLWKSPMGGTAAKAISVAPPGTAFKGLAVDGNAS